MTVNVAPRPGSPTTATPPPVSLAMRSTEREELLTVGQVANELQVILATVRTWIQSGALRATRPGNGLQPGRTYRVRRKDLAEFVAASQSRPAAS